MLEKIELLELMICPACRVKLKSLSRCSECEEEFATMDGVPSVFQTRRARVVSFEFTPQRAVAGEAFRRAFNYPPVEVPSQQAWHHTTLMRPTWTP